MTEHTDPGHLLRDWRERRRLSQLELARATGIGTSTYLEEAALLARELQAAEFELPPIDPPFGPYGRFAARRELGAGGSVVPARRAVPP